MGSLVLLPHNRKLVENVGHGIARLGEVALERCQLLRRLTLGLAPGTIRLAWQIEMEEGRVQLAADLEASFVVPQKWWLVVAAISGQGYEVMCRVREFEDTRNKPVLHGG